jgi:Glycosyl transferases group 1
VCRNGVDLKRYALTLPERDYVGIGWSGATGHLLAMKPWLAEVEALMQERADTKFVSVGQGFASLLSERFGPERCMSIPFTSLETYPSSMTLYDIALAPAGDNTFFRGKSDLRWLEASAIGIPLVADPLVYPEIESDVTGLHASTPDEVREHLSSLISDAGLRSRIGNAAKAYVTEHRTIQTTVEDWAVALQGVAGTVARAA